MNGLPAPDRPAPGEVAKVAEVAEVAKGAKVAEVAGVDPAHRLSVFINCPFDGDYGESMDTIIFTILCCGFQPRSAIETDDTHDSRLKRIVDAMRRSRFSIHDLSRIYGEGRANTARLNMPLELGIAMAMRLSFENRETQRLHEWTALVKAGAPYARAVSDLNGHDLKRYTKPEGLISQVMLWLVTRIDVSLSFEPQHVAQTLPRFHQALKARRERWPEAGLAWKYVLEEGRRIAEEADLRATVAPVDGANRG